MKRKDLRIVKIHGSGNIYYFHQWIIDPVKTVLTAVVEDEFGYPAMFEFNQIQFLPDDYNPERRTEEWKPIR